MSDNNNVLKLTGTVKETELAYTDEEKGEKFYRIFIETTRLSDNVDVLPVNVSEKLLYDINCEPGDLVSINGYVRTRNFSDEEGHSHLEVFGYAYKICNVEPDDIDPKTNNIVRITGVICRPVRHRKTLKTQREVTDLVVAVNRPYRRRDYIPCITWSRNAILASNRSVGDMIQITGRFQDRQYRKRDVEEVLTTYEVSVNDLTVLEPAMQEDEELLTEPVEKEMIEEQKEE